MYRHKLQSLTREAGLPVTFGPNHFVPTQAIIQEIRTLKYIDQWKRLYEESWFHIKTSDHSLFVFSEGSRPSYHFFHCPLAIPTIREFLASQGIIDSPRIRREAESDYQETIATASKKEHVTPIRFDYDPTGYESGVHPAAHIHIGLENDIRLSSNLMSAKSFVLFVMRHMYPQSWANLLGRNGREAHLRAIRSKDTSIPEDYWCREDEFELYLR